jgi:hypothetical protein
MSVNFSKTFLTVSASVLFVAVSAMSSDARQHGTRSAPVPSEATYYHSDYNAARDRDNSCFRSTGLPDLYACSTHGG